LDSVRRYIEGNGEAKEAERLVLGVLDSLEVLDWGLFDEDDEEWGDLRSAGSDVRYLWREWDGGIKRDRWEDRMDGFNI
jgi:hypothetical protein